MCNRWLRPADCSCCSILYCHSGWVLDVEGGTEVYTRYIPDDLWTSPQTNCSADVPQPAASLFPSPPVYDSYNTPIFEADGDAFARLASLRAGDPCNTRSDGKPSQSPVAQAGEFHIVVSGARVVNSVSAGTSERRDPSEQQLDVSVVLQYRSRGDASIEVCH